MAQRTNIPYGSQADDARKAAVTRWAIASLATGGVGAAFMPAALLGGGDWASAIESVAPLWTLFCLIGMASGLRGLYLARRRVTARSRTLAAAGAILSLFAFTTMTLIALIGGQ